MFLSLVIILSTETKVKIIPPAVKKYTNSSQYTIQKLSGEKLINKPT